MFSKKPLFKMNITQSHSSNKSIRKRTRRPNLNSFASTNAAKNTPKIPDPNIIRAVLFRNLNDDRNIISHDDSSSLSAKTIRSPREICKHGSLNSFIAFRAYYSQFANGINQNKLSSILSKFWKSNQSQQTFWDRLTEQYKQIDRL
ncbi:transcriptional co-activator mating type protein alpha KNAG_0C00150 [Huiozyma naganishii CBS 8797]|uniref:Alpha box domain-containing protein n=1 Tax=Huiozyma naganishii (strain ATCC MYA-139 / BCRC 22969 / CBS 8797 / KCTC 17520 / NBRC 10181 / NCYC 3082 / Yp74L-3) TaxID=1071383 RepID=J7R2T1_HUIN7|nr:hypothetical protein KNAG_0C00150 [Kazachstania naganishii CBS 8797]CCK69130.1 hypothetical protein KNAG_0C00150 [Kazachstania naganishii CBS 8797]